MNPPTSLPASSYLLQGTVMFAPPPCNRGRSRSNHSTRKRRVRMLPSSSGTVPRVRLFYTAFIRRGQWLLITSPGWLVSQGIISDSEVTSRLLILPHVRECSKADLPPLEPEEGDGSRSPVAPPASARRVSSRFSRTQALPQASSSRLPSQPLVPPPGTVRMADLGLGHRPQAIPDMSRVCNYPAYRKGLHY